MKRIDEKKLISARRTLAEDKDNALEEYWSLAGDNALGDEPKLAIAVLKYAKAAETGIINIMDPAEAELLDALDKTGYVDPQCLALLAPLYLKANKTPLELMQLDVRSDFVFHQEKAARIRKVRDFLIKAALSEKEFAMDSDTKRSLYEGIAAIDAHMYLTRQTGRRSSSFFTLFAMDSDEIEMQRIYDYLGKSRFHYYDKSFWASSVIVPLSMLIILAIIIYLS